MTISSAASPSWRRSKGASEPQPLRAAMMATVSIIRSVMTTPGRMPAMKRAPIETLAIMP